MNLTSTLPAQSSEAALMFTAIQPAGLLKFTGEDSLNFLQGQLSSDLRTLTNNNAQYSSYSTPKGRMLASFLIFRTQEDYWLQLDSTLAAAMQKRLSMFIMRSKTRCSDASAERELIGLQGSAATSFIETLFASCPKNALDSVHSDHASVIALAGERYQIIATPEAAAEIKQQLLAQKAVEGDASVWMLGDIRAGIAWISSATQEAFVPQMANLDLIGGVSFNKGCYPGQEIVARTRYIGQVKRRTYRAAIQAEQIQLGQEVFSPEMNGQASGKIIWAASTQTGLWEVLVSAQISSIEHGLHLNDASGPTLEILPLPYAIE